MTIFKSNNGLNVLICEHRGPRLNRYKMFINGWYNGGFSVGTDTAALKEFMRILAMY